MKKKNGFTLVEIIAVIALIAIVAGLFAVNMSRTLSKQNEEDKKKTIAEITSAASSYAYTNPEAVEKLYNGYAFVDISIGELRDAGLLSEKLKDAETGEILPDDYLVRLSLNEGLLSAEYVGKEIPDGNQYAIKASNLYVEYKETTENWCNVEDNLYKGINAELGIYNNTTAEWVHTNSNYKNFIQATSCNVNQSLAGSYSVTYKYLFPGEESMGRTVTRTVYVGASQNDVLSFTASINQNKKIPLNKDNVNISIVETLRSGATLEYPDAVIHKTSNGYQIYQDATLQTVLPFKISDFNVSAAGSGTASIVLDTVNSNGAQAASLSLKYTVTDLLQELEQDVNLCSSNGTYFVGEQNANYVRYAGYVWRMYYCNLNNGIKLVLDTSFTKAPYGQIGGCIADCCNQGRYIYLSLGDGAEGVPDDSMDTVLTEYFYDTLKNNSLLTLISTQTVTKSQTVNDLSHDGSRGVVKKQLSTKVALMSKDEYSKIAGCNSNGTSCTYANNNYVKNGHGEFWLLDYHSSNFGDGAYNEGANTAYVYDYIVNSNGLISTAGARLENRIYTVTELEVRPVIQIKTTSKITTGDGTRENPYVLQ